VLAAGVLLAQAARTGELPDAKDLPDFSWAGYHAGEKGLPRREPTVNVKDFGGAGDGKSDDSAALKAALAKAAETEGVVAIPPGRWLLTEVLEIRASGVVLQGAGSGKTTLVCPKPLAKIKGPSRRWSWSGGMIEVAPARGPSTRVARVTETASAGGDCLVVDALEGPPPEPGEWLELRWFNDKGKDTLLDHLYGGAIPRTRMGRELQSSTGVRVREWVRIKAVEGNAVTIAQPLRIDARPEWNPTLVRRPFIEEVGIEGITIEFPNTKYPGHLREHGYNGIAIGSAVNCWVRDVATVNADSGIFIGACKHVTVQDVACTGRTMHHALCVSWGSDCLLTRWQIDAPHIHGTTISWCAHGNVFSEGRGWALAMDSHRAASFQNLHTNIAIEHGRKVVNPFRSGGSGPRGPHSAKQNVYWNVENRFDPASKTPAPIRGHSEWPLGIFVGWHGNRPLDFKPVQGMRQQILDLNKKPAIENLHLYQRAKRLSKR